MSIVSRLGWALVLVVVITASCAAPTDEVRLADQVAQYATVPLTADLTALTENERAMLPLLIDAAREMDEIFWLEAWGTKDSLLASLGGDTPMARFADINYGPWDRLAGNAPFVPGIGAKPDGARFYPADMTRDEFEEAAADLVRGPALRSLYTLVRRDGTGALFPVPYHVAFAPQVARAAAKLREAAKLADDLGLQSYLLLRADALLSDEYRASDLAWMDMKTNGVDVVIGPIETYEDQLVGAKASHEAYVLLKDRVWSQRLERYAALLPALQRELPVPDPYKQEAPGTDADLNAYDAVYYAGEANAGSKTIAINLPNDETVQLAKGTRRLQLKNTMRAKFDLIAAPIAATLLEEDQAAQSTFDAFFANTMFHEVAHGLGIKNTLTGTGTVREALKEEAGALEEGKADVLGLYMITALQAQGVLEEGSLESYYVTFLAGMFRSIRFGAASAHGRANVARFNFFAELGAFTRDATTGRYRVDMDNMGTAIDSLSATILKLQGDGDYEGVKAFMATYGSIGPELQTDLDRVAAAGVPVDIIFDQGVGTLGLPTTR